MMVDKWPDDNLAIKMLRDAHAVLKDEASGQEAIASDVGCHVLSLLARVRELEEENGLLKQTPQMEFADGRQPTTNERQLFNLLTWREREAQQNKQEIQRLREQFKAEIQRQREQLEAAIDRSQSWKNLAERYKELAEARGEALDRQRSK